MKYLIVIDMQRDFIDGALGTAEAVSILPGVVEKVKSFEGKVIFTRDTHGENYLETQEGKNLPVPHCIKGTEGWELAPELEEIRVERGYDVYDKPTFGSTELSAALKADYEKGELDAVELCGVCTDICVISNALLIKAAMPEMPVYLLPSLCAGTTVENHLCAITAMKMCQIYTEE